MTHPDQSLSLQPAESSDFKDSDYADTLNALVEMQESMLYAARRKVLNDAERIIVDLEARLNAAPKAPAPCIGKDPLCPCADGDVCHYVATKKTKAMAHPVAPPVTPLPLEAASPQGSATRLPTYAEGTYRQLDAGLDAAAQRPIAAAVSHAARPDEPKESVGDPTALRSALEADARRYRWLRNQPPTYASGERRRYAWHEVAYTLLYDEVTERLGEELDAAIDAALVQQEPKL